jgi:hypothetical protein
MTFYTPTNFIEPNGSIGDEPVNFSDAGDIAFPKPLFDLDEVVPVNGFIPFAIG